VPIDRALLPRCASGLLAPVLLVALAVALAGCASVPTDASRRSLVDAERAFATMAAERGIRASFIANFADDGVAFNPAPFRLREAWGARPPPANPLALSLAWHPVIAGVARSGTLGFTSGPSLLVDTTGANDASHGVYFSVWRRDGDGTWKVAADAGIRTPRAPVDADFGADPVVAVPPATAGSIPALDAADAGASGGAAAFAASLAEDARWHVDERLPVIGREAIRSARSGEARALRFATAGRGSAPSGDLGYTYGAIDANGAPAGGYLHLWTRGGDGAWRLLVAVHLLPR
jgi:ketosteroid isomerase-like protein